MPDALYHIRADYTRLCTRVSDALRTLLGDYVQLQQRRREVMNFLNTSTQNRHLIPFEEFCTLQDSITIMVQLLDDAVHLSTDPADGSLQLITHTPSPSGGGRPKLWIDPIFLAAALDISTITNIARILRISTRTVRRRALELGLVDPGAPLFNYTEQEDGSTLRTVTSTTPPVANLTDTDLDTFMVEILQVFPTFGRRMIHGCLRSRGYRVPMARVTSSYVRVHGTTNAFGDRRLHRRIYRVAGPNSLWHHDGQHGLIRWKFVIHCFVDGFTRLITALRVHNNNRADTVLALFLHAVAQFGCPSRVRGDHGTENVRVAQAMDDMRGTGRGSYIWGRSVHNTRSERLWYDVTTGFGAKWKAFFLELEHLSEYALDPDRPAHIWLLHHLFLAAINQDAGDWVAVWNSHAITGHGLPHQAAPQELFLMGMAELGARGLNYITADDQVVTEDMAGYGIDWEVYDSHTLMTHHLENNPQEWESENPFSAAGSPDRLSDVPCDSPNCPFTTAEVASLDAELRDQFGVALESRDMTVRKGIWIHALKACDFIYQTLYLNISTS